MSKVLFYMELMITPFEWEISAFPSLCSLWHKYFCLPVVLVLACVASFPCECVKKWKLYPERDADLTYPLLVILVLPYCRSKELRTPFHTLIFPPVQRLLYRFCFVYNIFITTSKWGLRNIFFSSTFLIKWEEYTVHLTISEGKKVIIHLACAEYSSCAVFNEYWSIFYWSIRNHSKAIRNSCRKNLRFLKQVDWLHVTAMLLRQKPSWPTFRELNLEN